MPGLQAPKTLLGRHGWTGIVYMYELPAAARLLVDLRFSAVGLNHGAVSFLFRDEVPIELGPCRVTVDVYGHIARGEFPFREG
jgi:hypothetical protein